MIVTWVPISNGTAVLLSTLFSGLNLEVKSYLPPKISLFNFFNPFLTFSSLRRFTKGTYFKNLLLAILVPVVNIFLAVLLVSSNSGSWRVLKIDKDASLAAVLIFCIFSPPSILLIPLLTKNWATVPVGFSWTPWRRSNKSISLPSKALPFSHEVFKDLAAFTSIALVNLAIEKPVVSRFSTLPAWEIAPAPLILLTLAKSVKVLLIVCNWPSSWV